MLHEKSKIGFLIYCTRDTSARQKHARQRFHFNFRECRRNTDLIKSQFNYALSGMRCQMFEYMCIIYSVHFVRILS